MTRNIFVVILISLLYAPANSQESVFARWDSFEKSVRDLKLEKQTAEAGFQALIGEITEYTLQNYSFTISTSGWSNPLNSAFKVYKNDFRPAITYGPYKKKGYSFYDGNKHGGHPAFDFIIKDKDIDLREDSTGKEVNALAMAEMVVLSISDQWQKGSKIRGGKYAWLYNPVEKKLFYYAHLNAVTVVPGQFLEAGEDIGTVGRTGYLADKRTSPTHIHLMVLDISRGEPVPYNYYTRIGR